MCETDSTPSSTTASELNIWNQSSHNYIEFKFDNNDNNAKISSSTAHNSNWNIPNKIGTTSRVLYRLIYATYSGLIQNQKDILKTVQDRLLYGCVAFLIVVDSFIKLTASVQVLRFTNTIRDDVNASNRITSTNDNNTNQLTTVDDNALSAPEKCVTCEVLAAPDDHTKITADVVFIHGLEGSLLKTWRQGTWNRQRAKKHEKLKTQPSNCDNGERLQQQFGAQNCPVCISIMKQFEEISYMEMLNSICVCSRLNDVQNTTVSKCWPKDWLPLDCPGARIISLSYTTDPHLWTPVWIKKRNRSSMEQRSKEMMELLLQHGVGQQPIVWVAHSKGGLFVKQMIVTAWEGHTKLDPSVFQYTPFYYLTKAILFFSVPHRGSDLADFQLPLYTRSIELLEIQKNSQFVLNLHEKFLAVCNNGEFQPEIFSFIETVLTFMSFIHLRIVSYDSADPGVGQTCGVPLDHRDICKPSDRNCIIYKKLVELINKV